MRILLDILVAGMLVLILAGVVWQTRERQDLQASKDLARAEVHRFQQQVNLQLALRTTNDGDAGYPESIDPKWFKGNVPSNPLLGQHHPWVEIAPHDQRHLQHPPDPTATDRETAAYWYNPRNGIVRTRVTAGISDARSLELYNFVNGCNRQTLFGTDG